MKRLGICPVRRGGEGLGQDFKGGGQDLRFERFPDEMRKFIETTNWTWAKTYADTWPHHYIVRDRVDEELFVKMVQHIRRFGYEGRFYRMKITYFEEDGLVYWTMGDPIEKTTIINRCPKESTYEYRLKEGSLPGIDIKR